MYVLDGFRIESEADFFQVVGEAVGGPGWYFGSNFDAFSDCLAGGFGTPEDREFGFVLEHSSAVRDCLGYAATVDWWRDHLDGCAVVNVPAVLGHIDDAEREHGPTLFDTIIQIFAERGVPVELR